MSGAKLHSYKSGKKISIKLNQEMPQRHLPVTFKERVLFTGSYQEFAWPSSEYDPLLYADIFTADYFGTPEEAIRVKLALEQDLNPTALKGWLSPIPGAGFYKKLVLRLDSETKVLDLNNANHYFLYVIANVYPNDIGYVQEGRATTLFIMEDTHVAEQIENNAKRTRNKAIVYLNSIEDNKHELLVFIKLLSPIHKDLETYQLSELYSIADGLCQTSYTNYDIISTSPYYEAKKIITKGLLLKLIKIDAYYYHVNGKKYKESDLLEEITKDLAEVSEASAVWKNILDKYSKARW